MNHAMMKTFSTVARVTLLLVTVHCIATAESVVLPPPVAFTSLAAQSLTPAMTSNMEVQITTDVIYGPGALTTSGNRIVWAGPDYPSLQAADQIYLYDMSAGQQTQITNGPLLGNQNSTEPTVQGGQIVYLDPSFNVVFYNVATQTKQTIARLSDYPAFDGSNIVYVDINTTNLHVYNVLTHTQTQITTGSPLVVDAAISGNQIAYFTAGSPGSIPLHLYNIATKQDTVLTTLNLPLSFSLCISGNNIVWSDVSSSGPTQIFLYDVSTHTKRQLSNYSNGAGSPSLYGDTVVWVNFVSVNTQSISAYNLVTQTEQQITTPVSSQMLPQIWMDQVVWLDNRAGGPNWQVFLLQLPGPPAIPNIILPQKNTQGIEGAPFSYQIVALNSPIRYGAIGLPQGLHVDENSGLISGTPTVTGTFPVGLSASNASGSGTRTLVIKVQSRG